MCLCAWDAKYGKRSENMCGEAFIEELEQTTSSPSMRATFVKFLSGAHTKWHYHTGEQMLFATEGQGFVEFQDRPVLEIREGARVHTPAGVWHRHGAVEGKMLVHLAVTYGETKWDHADPCQKDSQYVNHLGLSVPNEIAYLNKRLLQAEEAGLSQELAPLLAKTFTMIRSSGEKIDRAAFLIAVPHNANRGRSVFRPNVHLVNECAIYTCVVRTTQKSDGTPNPGYFWNTRLFTREKEQWRCAEWQVIKVRGDE
jgi:quercetin dioxygenase-like cupin family protein